MTKVINLECATKKTQNDFVSFFVFGISFFKLYSILGRGVERGLLLLVLLLGFVIWF